MSRAALKRLSDGLASAERVGALFVITDLADLRAVLALAREAEGLRAALGAVECDRDFRVRCGEPIQDVVRAALAPLPARTDFERLFSPAERRKMARGKRR